MKLQGKYTRTQLTRWKRIPDHPYRILMVGGSGSGAVNVLPILINQ